jgi:T4 RnlA family RNA ligase
MMMLPTYEDAKLICEKNKAFKMKHETFGDSSVAQFNYGYASHRDFFDAHKDGSMVPATELRGITFLKEGVDGEWKRYLFVHKFFNVNQVQCDNKENSWMYDDIKHLDIVRVANKEDGSAIRFLVLNGELVAKTKFSFETAQADLAMAVVNNDPNLKAFILKTLELGLAALFEIVSPLNRIVLSYSKTDLKLLQLRNEENGEYLDIYNHPLVAKYSVRMTAKEPLRSLEEMFKMTGEVENKEGWVITFADGKMAKVKTDWYMKAHDFSSDHLKENILIQKILNEEIDDAVSFLPANETEKRDLIDQISSLVTNDVNSLATYVYDTFNANYTGNKKEFAVRFKKDDCFRLMAKLMKENTLPTFENAEKAVIDDILVRTRKLEWARTYLKGLGFNKELKFEK